MKKFHIFISLLLCTLLASCTFLNQTEPSSIVVNLPSPSVRAAVPDYVDHYQITAECRSVDYKKTITASASASYAEFESLSSGTYTVTVEAFDSKANKVADGKDTVKVQPGKKAEANIVLKTPVIEMNVSGSDIKLKAYYAKNPSVVYVQTSEEPVEIPYIDDELIFEAENLDSEFMTAWTLYSGEKEKFGEIEDEIEDEIEMDEEQIISNASTFSFNPFESQDINVDLPNIVSCFGKNITTTKLSTIVFIFTDTGRL
ncbi:hypothetical protein [Treponema sp.]|uniref:hypothetical protein n=1 Tax=Treponema sp. TaxID=166 RepID=UPI00298E8CF9|nr:hypothetical protein [Treponema sp.]MCQ2241487.1 hypothetical protein [Treponema sp.]